MAAEWRMIMKKNVLGAALALIMAQSCFGAAMPSASAAEVVLKEGVEHRVDFSTWHTGEYTLDELNNAVGDEFTVEDYSTANNSMKYSVVYDSTVGKNVLKMENTAATEDGFYLMLKTDDINGTNITYSTSSMTENTFASRTFFNKNIVNPAKKAVISGGLTNEKVQLHNNGWILLDKATTGYAGKGSWINESLVIDLTKAQQFMYITDKVGRVGIDGNYKLTSRGYSLAGAGGAIYCQDRIFNSCISDISFRTYPSVIASSLDKSSVIETANPGSITFEFDHDMLADTVNADNIYIEDASGNKVGTYVNFSEYTASVTPAAALVPSSEYRVVLTSDVANEDGVRLKETAYTFTTDESQAPDIPPVISAAWYENDFEHLKDRVGNLVNAADLLADTDKVSIAPASTDGIFEVCSDKDGNTFIKVPQPENNTAAYGFKLTFDDLFTAVGSRNVVAELDYYVDNTTASTYASFGRMNNTACLYVQNNILSQQTVTELKSGVNGEKHHYKWTMNSDGTMRVFADGERLSSGSGSYDIAFRNSASKPNCWEIYIQKGAAAYYTIDNLRIRDYPEATLAFKIDDKECADTSKISRYADEIYVNFDNIMNASGITADKFHLYKGDEEVGFTFNGYDAANRRAVIIPHGTLEAESEYRLVIDDGIANSENKALATKELSFTTAKPVGITSAAATGINTLRVEFDGYVSSLSDISVDNTAAKSVSIERNRNNWGTSAAVITTGDILDANGGTVVIGSGTEKSGAAFKNLTCGYTAEDKYYIDADRTTVGAMTTPIVNISLLKNSALQKSIAVAAAFYNGGDMTGAVIGEFALVDGKNTAELAALDTGAYAEPDAELGIYVWSSIKSMVPVCGKITLKRSVTVHIIGDSKVCEYYDKSYPQQGWGHYIGEYLIASAAVNNRAVSGTSTATYRTGKTPDDPEKNYEYWAHLKENIKAGDYVLIDLAHNDAYAAADGTKTTIEEYKANIAGYVDEIRELGAEPVLMSTFPTLRYGFNNEVLIERGQAMKAVAKEKQTAFLDVNSAANKIFEGYELEAAKNAFYMTNSVLKEVYKLTDAELKSVPNSSIQNNGYDLVHFPENGAKAVCEIVVGELKNSDSPLASYVK